MAVKGNPVSHHDDHAQKCVYKSRQLRRPLSEELHRNTDTVEIEHVVAHHAKRENEQKEVADVAEWAEDNFDQSSR